ncbi:MAG: Holliday junction branch migration protein RuvA [Christensenellales bacterium]
MYAFIEGLLDEKRTDSVVINCSGVGYLLFVSKNSLSSVGSVGDTVRLYTYLQVREDSMALYGFFTKQEKRMFERLIGVSGIGPKVANAVLSVMMPDQLALAIIAGDDKAFVKVPGVGKKTAQRIILELKEKIDTQEVAISGAEAVASLAGGSVEQEAVAALVALGYGHSEAALSVANIAGQTQDLSELITLALRQFGKN